jgi:uncharacterized protein YcbK (DUF882 family)
MLQHIKYFIDSEFECPCCPGQHLISQELVSKLDSARIELCRPIVITSGYRCIHHNIDVGGLISSSHRRGLAVDIRCLTSGYRYRLIQALLAVGIKRIGIREDFIHVDIDPKKDPEVIWVY